MNSANFERSINGISVRLFHIFSQNISCFITNYGARIVSLTTMDKNARMIDMVLGFGSIDEYIRTNEKYYGAIIGRFANRIANGAFTINKTKYTLAKNNDNNSLHGGTNAFHNQAWNCISHEENKLILEFISPHLDEGFPGELKTQVIFTISDSTLSIEYRAVTTEDTILNLTHHSYFNLNGEGSGPILNHSLRLNSDYYTPVNENAIPTGLIEMVADSPFDFVKHKKIGVDINNDHQQLMYGHGYDHNFVINQYVEGELNLAAEVSGNMSKIKMEVWTTEPGVQFYTANHLDGLDIGKSGNNYNKRTAFCLETQHFPDSPNQTHFPSTLLEANQVFQSTTEYRFSVL